jgi:hypothetical protein
LGAVAFVMKKALPDVHNLIDFVNEAITSQQYLAADIVQVGAIIIHTDWEVILGEKTECTTRNSQL